MGSRIMIGVPSSLFSGRGPRLSVLNRHATSSLLKLLASICDSGEYLLPARSAVYIGHSPFLVLGIGLDWPRSDRFSEGTVATAATMRAAGAIHRNAARVIGDLLRDKGTRSRIIAVTVSQKSEVCLAPQAGWREATRKSE